MCKIKVGVWYKVVDYTGERVNVEKPRWSAWNINSISPSSAFKVVGEVNHIVTCKLRNGMCFRINAKLIDTSVTYNY